eukprot:6891688-Pyramimonas_sp.AAC.1
MHALHPTDRTSNFRQLNWRPYCCPARCTQCMYSEASSPVVATSSVSSAYTSSCTCCVMSRLGVASRFASWSRTVMTIANRNGDKGHPWLIPKFCG